MVSRGRVRLAAVCGRRGGEWRGVCGAALPGSKRGAAAGSGDLREEERSCVGRAARGGWDRGSGKRLVETEGVGAESVHRGGPYPCGASEFEPSRGRGSRREAEESVWGCAIGGWGVVGVAREWGGPHRWVRRRHRGRIGRAGGCGSSGRVIAGDRETARCAQGVEMGA